MLKKIFIFHIWCRIKVRIFQAYVCYPHFCVDNMWISGKKYLLTLDKLSYIIAMLVSLQGKLCPKQQPYPYRRPRGLSFGKCRSSRHRFSGYRKDMRLFGVFPPRPHAAVMDRKQGTFIQDPGQVLRICYLPDHRRSPVNSIF